MINQTKPVCQFQTVLLKVTSIQTLHCSKDGSCNTLCRREEEEEEEKNQKLKTKLRRQHRTAAATVQPGAELLLLLTSGGKVSEEGVSLLTMGCGAASLSSSVICKRKQEHHSMCVCTVVRRTEGEKVEQEVTGERMEGGRVRREVEEGDRVMEKGEKVME